MSVCESPIWVYIVVSNTDIHISSIISHHKLLLLPASLIMDFDVLYEKIKSKRLKMEEEDKKVEANKKVNKIEDYAKFAECIMLSMTSSMDTDAAYDLTREFRNHIHHHDDSLLKEENLKKLVEQLEVRNNKQKKVQITVTYDGLRAGVSATHQDNGTVMDVISVRFKYIQIDTQ